jgi:dTMP kinase
LANSPVASPVSGSVASVHGKFITFEGIDGCGKSTQAALLAQRLEDRDLTVLRTREPGGTRIGKALRHVLLDPEYKGMVPECELLLFLADRAQHLAEVIRPALERGEVVVCDRFHDATVAFQRYARGMDFSAVQPLLDQLVRPKPSITFWLDADVALADSRIVKREGDAAGYVDSGALTRMELEPSAFHQRVRDGYRKLAEAEPGRIERVDAAPPVQAVHEEVWARLTHRFRV